jgi:hypothetical protein
LLLPQVITEKLAPSYVPGIDPGYGMVHQQVNIKFGNAGSLGDRAVGLPKVITPLCQCRSVLLVLGDMPADTVCWEEPVPRARCVENASKPHNPDQTADHRARKGDVKGLVFSTLRLGNVQDSVP